jgi:hypothetical protein
MTWKMRRTERFQDGEGTVIVIKDSPPRSWFGRICRFIGFLLLFLLISAFPLLLMVEGSQAFFTGEITVFRKRLPDYKVYGHEALIWAWFYIAFGMGILAYASSAFTHQRWLQWLMWTVTILCLGLAMHRWLMGAGV